MSKRKIAVVGGGIVGLAIAYKIQKSISNSKVYLFEKENEIDELFNGYKVTNKTLH